MSKDNVNTIVLAYLRILIRVLSSAAVTAGWLLPETQRTLVVDPDLMIIIGGLAYVITEAFYAFKLRKTGRS